MTDRNYETGSQFETPEAHNVVGGAADTACVVYDHVANTFRITPAVAEALSAYLAEMSDLWTATAAKFGEGGDEPDSDMHSKLVLARAAERALDAAIADHNVLLRLERSRFIDLRLVR